MDIRVCFRIEPAARMAHDSDGNPCECYTQMIFRNFSEKTDVVRLTEAVRDDLARLMRTSPENLTPISPEEYDANTDEEADFEDDEECDD